MAVENLGIPRVIISGTGAGVGKSLITMGLAYELRRRRHSVSCAVLGPQIAQTTILKRIAGRSARCLDEGLLSSSQLLVSLFQSGVGADFVLIEGRNGLFDGTPVGTFRGSDAEMAALTKSPVVLVVDARGFGASVAALIKGFSVLSGGSRTNGGFDIGGTILNRADLGTGKQAKDLAYYNKALDSFGMSPLLGLMPEFVHDAVFPSGIIHQGKNETLLPRQFLVELQRLVQQHVDIDRLIEQAELAPAVSIADFSYEPMPRRCRIAVSDDSCFHLCFQDNLEWLRYFGAELVTFSPLADSELPKKIGAVYLTGASLPAYAEELGRNTSMMHSLAAFADSGGVVYAEGSGAAYLCRDYRPEDAPRSVPGVGIVDASAVFDSAGFSYDESVTIEETVLGRPGLVVRGINTGEWRTSRDERVMLAMRVSRNSKPAVMDAFSPGPQIIATFSLLHFGSNPQVARNLADAAEVVLPTGTL
jgi:cobyrinic acid a,c-diamide synthase